MQDRCNFYTSVRKVLVEGKGDVGVCREQNNRIVRKVKRYTGCVGQVSLVETDPGISDLVKCLTR